MSQATERYALEPAPAGLALVHELLNTISAGAPREPDLLGDLGTAQAWLDAAARTGASSEDLSVRLREPDLEALRSLRTDLRAVLGAPGTEAAPDRVLASATVGAVLQRDGRVALVPRGEDARRFVGAVLLEVSVAQQADRWRRLKLCRNERCAVAFYDRSRNNSGVWHDVRVCGNAVNLRASRARRRAGGVPPTDG